MPRGGKRQATPGSSYAQRTDLNTRLPTSTPTGLPYGENQALSNAQRTIPMAPSPAPAGPPPAPAPGGAPNLPVPGARPWTRPTERPNEPVTTGVPSGPGPGPEALGAFGQGLGENMAQMLGAAAQAAGSPTLDFLARQAAAQGQ